MTVYFVHAEDRGRWKIGYTAGDGRRRLASGATFCFCRAWVECEIAGGVDVEEKIHARFAALRVSDVAGREVFETSEELEQFVQYCRHFGTIDGFDEWKAQRGRVCANCRWCAQIPGDPDGECLNIGGSQIKTFAPGCREFLLARDASALFGRCAA